MKLTEAQRRALRRVERSDGRLTAWVIGTSTCEALRKRGLVFHHWGDKPFSKGRDNEEVCITPAGRLALQEEERR